ncbi:MAG TPA: hypothetical protein VEG32_02295 [Clostridia bacterium]|nr:hypothetical protein [Clostridia bacterium]
MRSVTRRKQERGVALLLAIFALMLLAAVGMTMLYSSDTETGVNNNFRDSQVATYAAMSGLQEARERLRQSAGTGDIPWPTDLPSPSAPNVIYIVNPAPGETVAPWDPSNRYYDRDLCGGTYNMPAGFCNGTQPPGGAAWRVVYDNSNSTVSVGGSTTANANGAKWQKAVPLHYKWVRINLKSDNMIASVPTRTGADGSIVCWDGSAQIPRPAGYGNDCAPDGSLVLVFDPNSQGGSGYNPGVGNEPVVTISAPGTPGGVQATAVSHVETVSTGSLTSISITNPGTGYTGIPMVTISPPDQLGGVQATAVATLPGSSVDSVTLGTPDANSYCYTTGAPQVTFGSTGSGSGAEATAALSDSFSCIGAISVTSHNQCDGMGGTSQTFTASGGGGSGFVGRITFDSNNEKPIAWTVESPGTGYSSVPNGTVSVGGCNQQVTFTLGRRVSSVTVNPHGTGYLTAPNVLFSAGASGSTRQPATAILGGGGGSGSAGSLVSIVLTHPGSGYSLPPTVTITAPGPGGTQATAIANLGSTGRVTSLTLTNPGKNYPMSPNPTVTIAPPTGGGTQATASAHVAAGSTYGQVALITAYAETPTYGNRRGAQSVMQMEAATSKRDPWSLAIGGALTLAGPTPVFGTPNSDNFGMNGNDANSCGETAINRPSIGVYDNPNAPADPSPIQTILGQLARPDHFIGVNGTADVQNVWGAIGGQAITPQTLQAFTDNIAALVASGRPGAGTTLANALNGNAGSLTYIDGDATLSGSDHGHGVLVVTGTLTISGNYSWDGIILVVGEGHVVFSGGGSGQINGSIYVAKIKNDDGTLASDMLAPRIDYDGGGGNGVQYDHCLADNLLTGLPPVPAQADTQPMQILSVRRMSR